MAIIIQAGIEHIDDIVPLFDAYRMWYQQPSDLEGAKAFLSQRIEKKESVILLAYDKQQAVGFTQLYPIFTSVGMQRTWLLNDLFVQPEARGKSIATKLLDAAKQYGRSTGAKWLMLQTGHDNIHAQNVYSKNGWQKVSDIFYEFVL